VQKTDNAVLSWTLAPLGLAARAWGASFYCGCKNLIRVQTAVMANYNLLQLTHGTHPEQPDHPEASKAAWRGTRTALKTNVDRAQFYALSQFRLAIIGALLFLVWHVVEIYVRTAAVP
jgi:hypothetical protein